MSSIAARLDAYVLRAAERGPFDWAGNNCCQFAARWVAEVEGHDPMASLPTTPDRRAAWRLIASLGGLADAITQMLGRPPIAPAFAEPGDVVMANWPPAVRASVGICAGRTAMLIDEHGASIHVPTLHCIAAWKVTPA